MQDKEIFKRINFNFSGQQMLFDVSQALFSSAKIDDGTKMLLNSLRKNKEINYGRILDVGCGYGVMGIFLKKTHPESEVDCTDRDELALSFTEHNAKLNNCKINVYGSLDFQEVNGKFDLIVCNFPAKLGENGLRYFVYNSSKHLDKGGVLAIVIVKELKNQFENILREEIVIKNKEENNHYVTYHLKFNYQIIDDKDPYLRNNILYKIQGKEYALKTAVDIPEFDSPHFITQCVSKIFENLEKGENYGKNVTIINPFQGHIAISALHFLKPAKIILISKDLLSLEFSKNNLIKNNFNNVIIKHTYFSDEALGDLCAWHVESDENIEVVKDNLKKLLQLYSQVIIGSSKNKINRIIDKKIFHIIAHEERGKYQAILIKKSS